MAVLKKIKFGSTTSNIQFTEVKPVSGGVITATPSHTGLNDTNNPEYAIDLTIADDGTLVKDNGALKVGTVPAAQVSVAAGGHNPDAEPADGKTFVAQTVEGVLTELNDKINETGNVARTYTMVDDTINVQDLPSNVSKRYRLQETIGSQSPTLVGDPIDILKDNSLLAAKLSTMDATWNGSAIVDGTGAEALVLVYKDANGAAQVIAINVSDFLKEAEFGNGLQVTNGVVSVKIDTTSEKDSENADFLTVGADGVKIQGIKDEINRKIAALDVTTDAAVDGQYVAAIQETDGIVSVKTRANVSEAVLNNYAKGTAPASLDIADTDTINQALAKLEHQVDAAEAAAQAHHSVVATDTNASHLTLGTSRNNDGATVYTIGEKNIASASDLTAEVTRAQNAEGEIAGKVGLTGAEGSRTFTPTTNYGTGSTTIVGNMQALDTQLKTVSDKLANIKYNVDGTTLILSGITQDTSLTA